MLLKKTHIIFSLFFLAMLTLMSVFIQPASAATIARLGGMNLDGYCSSLGQGSAGLNGNTWTCTTPRTNIDMSKACQWQYPNQNASAVQDTAGNVYSWTCYSNTPDTTPAPNPTTAIPTPTRIPGVTITPTPTQPIPTPTQSVPTPTATPPTSGALSIFDDAMGSGWRDASYNTTSSSVISPVYSKSVALSAKINADGGLDFQSVNGQSTNGYTTIHFALRASAANPRYEVYADRTYGQPLTAPVSLNNYGGQPTTTGWKEYDIPLASLGASNTIVKDFVIHDATGTSQAIVYVDQVELRSSGTVVTPTPTTSAPTPTPTRPAATPIPTQTPTPTATPTPAGSTYLSLGDSFAFGYHLAKYQQEVAANNYNPASFNDGFDAVFFNNLLGKNVVTQEINYACPGETTTSFINGGCAFHNALSSLHGPYPVSQSQLQAAVSYLNANPGKVTVITVEIGVNDAIVLANTCDAQSNPVNCYNTRTAGVLATARQNYTTIVSALQQAAPQARIILVKSPDPVFSDGSDALVNGLNQIVDDIAAARGLREADDYSIFTASNVCSLTNYCASPSDFHPNAAGYSAMAAQIWNVSGYNN
jgi:lysophospholipase L1-like esterase